MGNPADATGGIFSFWSSAKDLRSGSKTNRCTLTTSPSEMTQPHPALHHAPSNSPPHLDPTRFLASNGGECLNCGRRAPWLSIQNIQTPFSTVLNSFVKRTIRLQVNLLESQKVILNANGVEIRRADCLPDRSAPTSLSHPPSKRTTALLPPNFSL